MYIWMKIQCNARAIKWIWAILNSNPHEFPTHAIKQNSVVKGEQVGFDKWPVEVAEIAHHFRRIYRIYYTLMKKKAKVVNTWPVGLGWTRILTDCARKFSPDTDFHSTSEKQVRPNLPKT